MMRPWLLIIVLAVPGLGAAEWEHHDAATIGVPPGPISALYADSRDRIWVGTESGGTAYYSDGRWTVVSLAVEDRLLGPVLGFTDGMGSLWMASQDAGLGRFEDGTWRLWVGTVLGYIPKPVGFARGTECFDDRPWGGFSILPEVSGGVPFVLTGALRTLAGGGGVLYLLYVDRIPSVIVRFQGGDHVDCWPGDAALTYMGLAMDVGDDGTAWVVFQETVAVKRPSEEGWESFPVPVRARAMTDVKVLEGGRAYFAGSNGLYLFDGATWDKLVDYKGTASITIRDDTVWLVHGYWPPGLSPPGLLRYRGGVLEELEYPNSSADFTSQDRIYIEVSGSGDLWIADEHGLWQRPHDGFSSVAPTGWGSVKKARNTEQEP